MDTSTSTTGEAAAAQGTVMSEGANSSEMTKSEETESIEKSEVKEEAEAIEKSEVEEETGDSETQEQETPEKSEAAELQEKLAKYEKANERLIGIFNQNPEIPQLLRYMDKGASFTEALAHVVDPSDLTPVEGDPDYEGWKKGQETRQKNMQERQNMLSELDNNLEMSQKEIDSFIKENNLGEEEAGKLLSTLDNILNQVYSGKLDKNLLTMLKKASTYDSDLETTRRQAEIKTRNQKIEAEKDKESKTDGLPDLTDGKSKEPAPQKDDIFSDAFELHSKKQIF